MTREALGIGIVGCTGRMGRLLLREVLAAPDCRLEAATARPGNAHLGEDAGRLVGLSACGTHIGDDAVALFAGCDVVIDFTQPEAVEEHARLAAQAKAALVVGTTGLTDDHHRHLAAAARHTPVIVAPNTSLGVVVMALLVERAAAALPGDYDIEIVELHHRHKVDAPSGTALMIGRSAARGRDTDFDTSAVLSRQGRTGPRPEGAIGFSAMRGGEIIGEHTAYFAGAGERLEISHRARDRSLYAQGALVAARWAHGQSPGLYDMRDVLGIT